MESKEKGMGTKASSGDDENLLKLDGSKGCTTQKPWQLCTLKGEFYGACIISQMDLYTRKNQRVVLLICAYNKFQPSCKRQTLFEAHIERTNVAFICSCRR